MPDRRVALCLVDSGNEFQKLLEADADTAARHAGLGLTVHYTGHDLGAQRERLESCIDARPRPDAILVLAVGDQGLARVARDAVRAGISWVFLNPTEDDVEGLRREAPAGVGVSVVCPDEVETGRIQGRQFRALLPDGGKVLYVQGNKRSLAARDRTAGMREASKGAPFEVVTLECGWSTKEAAEALRQWLGIVARGGLRLDLVGCQSDQIALGVMDALTASARVVGRPELARTPITGCDGTPSVGQRLVREGRLVATVVLPRSSGHAVQLVARTLARGETPPPAVLLKPSSFPGEGLLAALPEPGDWRA